MKGATSWWHDDLLAWVCPGGLLVTALALRFPAAVQALRAQAPELTLPAWLVAAYVVGLALSPLGRLVYALAQGLVWPRLRHAWAPAIAFLGARLERTEGLVIPDAARMSTSVFHDVDRRMREYLEAADPSAASALNRMKVLCSLACNAAAAGVVFVVVDVIAGNAPSWTPAQLGAGSLAIGLALIAAVYRERRRQRTQLSIWRRLRISAEADAGAGQRASA